VTPTPATHLAAQNASAAKTALGNATRLSASAAPLSTPKAVAANASAQPRSFAPVAAATLVTAQAAASTPIKVPPNLISVTQGTITAVLNKEVNLVVYDTISLKINIGSTAKNLKVTASGLPAGLKMSSNGVISGTIMDQENRSYPVTIYASDASGSTLSQKFDINVLAVHYPNWNNAGAVVSNGHVATVGA
jgi:hypothetical protein